MNLTRLLLFLYVFMFIGCEDAIFPDKSDSYLDLKDGEYVRSVPLLLELESDSLETKSEGLRIKSVTYFIYRSVNGGAETLVYRYTGNMTSFDFIFSDQATYRYRITVYANVPSLSSEPSASQILFSNESLSAFQMHGESGTITSYSSSVTVNLYRYVNKIELRDIKLNLPLSAEKEGSFIVYRAWLAGIPGDLAGGNIFNSDGNLSHTNALFYTTLNITISHNSSYSLYYPFYFYGSSATLILECKLGSYTVYYKSKVTGMGQNQSKTVNFEIFDTGYSSPSL